VLAGLVRSKDMQTWFRKGTGGMEDLALGVSLSLWVDAPEKRDGLNPWED